MSYDITFKVKVQDLDYYVNVVDNLTNITWNVRDIITKSTGLEWKNEQNNGYAKDVIPYIEKGLLKLQTNSDNYKQYESKTGYGTVEGTISFFEKILRDWRDYIMWKPQELIDTITFWIE